MEVVTVVLLAIIGYGIIRFINRTRREKQERRNLEYDEKRLGDENIFKKQAAFENRLDNNADLPDGIRADPKSS